MTAPQTYAADTLRTQSPEPIAPAEEHPAVTVAVPPAAAAAHGAGSPDSADSAASAALPAADTAAQASHPAPADSLHRDCACVPPPYRDVTAREIFGARSTTVSIDRLPLAPGRTLTDNVVFQGFVLLLAFTYTLLLHRHLNDARLLLGRISRDAASGKRLSDEPGGNGFSRFLNIAASVGMLFMGVVAVKYGDSFIDLTTQQWPHTAAVAMSAVATAAFAAIVGYQTGLLRAAGAVTLSQPLIARILLLRRTYFALAVVVVSPALLLFALCPRGTGGVWFIVVAASLVTIAMLYLWETLNLFISKKISILHWILYLCTVEIFPISLLWLLATR